MARRNSSHNDCSAPVGSPKEQARLQPAFAGNKPGTDAAIFSLIALSRLLAREAARDHIKHDSCNMSPAPAHTHAKDGAV
jgi:hypothetical protein